MKNSCLRIVITLALVFLLFNILFVPSMNGRIESCNKCTSESATIYPGSLSAYFYRIYSKPYILFGYNEGCNSRMITLEFDANASEVTINVIFNYTATMEYTAGPPIVLLTPFVAFGLKIENYTDYSWEYFKLKHKNGLCEIEGNVSVNVTLNTNNVKKGDSIILFPIGCSITDPFVVSPNPYQNYTKNISPLLRIAYQFPILHDILLEPMILPFFAILNNYECCSIVVNFI